MLHRATAATIVATSSTVAEASVNGVSRNVGIKQSEVRCMHFAAGLNYARLHSGVSDAARPQAKSNFAYLSSGITSRSTGWRVGDEH